MATFPGRDERAAPYSRTFAAGAAASTPLTTPVNQAQNATSGFVCIVTATGAQLVYKDCSGASVDTGVLAAVAGDVWNLPVAATELTTNTNLMVLAYWHGSTAR